MNDIMQLDELIEHARFHKQEYGDNFFVFLSKHYGKLEAEHTETHQDEQNEHEELPFKCQGQTFTITAFLLLDHTTETNTLEISDIGESNFRYLSSHSLLHKRGLLQPPKQL